MYGIMVGLLIIFSVQVFVNYKNEVSVLFTIGSILFFISDTLLTYFNTAKPMTKNILSLVMVTYIAAQSCIISGFIIN
jgi:hypothetical protein